MINRWIKTIKKVARIYREEPELIDALIKSKNPIDTIDDYFSRDEELKLERYEKNKELLKEYPTKSIYYKGRYLPLSRERIKVPVQVLITPEDPKIISDLKKWGLYQKNISPDKLALKVYKKYMKTYYRYKYDKDNWNGLNEFWEFPFELYAKYGDGKWWADCDSHAIALVSYMRAAGVPAGYVWVVVGNCKLGGHATVYVYSEDDKKFHHTNSTTPYFKTKDNKLTDFPLHKDAPDNDSFGIYNVWLSFNDIIARSKFNNKKISDIIEIK